MSKKKIIIIVLVAILAIIAIIVGVVFGLKKNNTKAEESVPTNVVRESQVKNVQNYVGELDDGTQINTNGKFNATSTYKSFSVSNIRLTLKNGITTFRATLTNTGTTATALEQVTLVLLGENGNELVTARGIIFETEPGSTQELAIAISSDYIHANGYKLME